MMWREKTKVERYLDDAFNDRNDSKLDILGW
jgi:hypothetical protein